MITWLQVSLRQFWTLGLPERCLIRSFPEHLAKASAPAWSRWSDIVGEIVEPTMHQRECHCKDPGGIGETKCERTALWRLLQRFYYIQLGFDRCMSYRWLFPADCLPFQSIPRLQDHGAFDDLEHVLLLLFFKLKKVTCLTFRVGCWKVWRRRLLCQILRMRTFPCFFGHIKQPNGILHGLKVAAAWRSWDLLLHWSWWSAHQSRRRWRRVTWQHLPHFCKTKHM